MPRERRVGADREERTMPGALVIGESLIDVVNDEAHRGEHPGDSPMNVAITISRAGANPPRTAELG